MSQIKKKALLSNKEVKEAALERRIETSAAQQKKRRFALIFKKTTSY